jgi:hypothetical protein
LQCNIRESINFGKISCADAKGPFADVWLRLAALGLCAWPCYFRAHAVLPLRADELEHSMKTLQELLGIELPIIQAPLAGVQGSALAVDVSNVGGLGSLPCAMFSGEALRKELVAIASQTRKPFNVNFFCRTPPKPDLEREAAWRNLLAPYYEEFGIGDRSPSGFPWTFSGRIPMRFSRTPLLTALRHAFTVRA